MSNHQVLICKSCSLPICVGVHHDDGSYLQTGPKIPENVKAFASAVNKGASAAGKALGTAGKKIAEGAATVHAAAKKYNSGTASNPAEGLDDVKKGVIEKMNDIALRYTTELKNSKKQTKALNDARQKFQKEMKDYFDKMEAKYKGSNYASAIHDLRNEGEKGLHSIWDHNAYPQNP